MQTTTLPIQINGGVQPPARPGPAASADPGQFSAALTRELAQRQESAAPPVPAAPARANAARPASQQGPAKADKGAAQAAPASGPNAGPAQPKAAGKAADGSDASDADKDDGELAEHPATAQVTDMLALAASLGQTPGKAAPAPTPAEAAALAPGATKAGGQAVDLAALQAATRALGKDAGEGATGKAFDALDKLKNPAAPAAFAGVATKAAATDAADPAAGFGAVQLAATNARAQVDTAPVAAGAHQALPEAAPLPQAQMLAQMQPAALQAAQAAVTGGVAGEHIAARVGSNGWDQQVGQKIVWMAAGGEQSAELTLNPPDLGPLQVVLNVSNDQASVTFSSNQLEVRQALENALPRLREMMSDSGIALGNATVNAGMPDQRQAQGEGQAGNRASQSARMNGGAEVEPTPRAGARVTSLGGRGMVDTFA
jgi:flagellar hook-length control protein FliK